MLPPQGSATPRLAIPAVGTVAARAWCIAKQATATPTTTGITSMPVWVPGSETTTSSGHLPCGFDACRPPHPVPTCLSKAEAVTENVAKSAKATMYERMAISPLRINMVRLTLTCGAFPASRSINLLHYEVANSIKSGSTSEQNRFTLTDSSRIATTWYLTFSQPSYTLSLVDGPPPRMTTMAIDTAPGSPLRR